MVSDKWKVYYCSSSTGPPLSCFIAAGSFIEMLLPADNALKFEKKAQFRDELAMFVKLIEHMSYMLLHFFYHI